MESGIHLKEFAIPLMIGMENPSSTGKDSGIYSVEYRIQDCLGLPHYPALQLVDGARLYAEQLLLHQVFVQHCWRSIPATYMCSNLFLDHNVFLHLKVGVCSTFCNLCCYVKEGKLLPEELFDVTTKGLCVHTTLI